MRAVALLALALLAAAPLAAARPVSVCAPAACVRVDVPVEQLPAPGDPPECVVTGTGGGLDPNGGGGAILLVVAGACLRPREGPASLPGYAVGAAVAVPFLVSSPDGTSVCVSVLSPAAGFSGEGGAPRGEAGVHSYDSCVAFGSGTPQFYTTETHTLAAAGIADDTGDGNGDRPYTVLPLP